jgi:hypothetical protein
VAITGMEISPNGFEMTVFQDDLIRSYRAFLDKRRAARPSEEYREPTDQEWQEFQKHFQVRKVALGTCGRPYGASCQHEHAGPAMCDAPRLAAPTAPPCRDHQQPARAHLRSTDERLARRSPGP